MHCRCDDESVVAVLTSGNLAFVVMLGIIWGKTVFQGSSTTHFRGGECDSWSPVSSFTPFLQVAGSMVPMQECRHPQLLIYYVGQQETGLDLTVLEKDTQRYFENCSAATTRWTYQSGIDNFVHFCHVTSPLPTSQLLLCSYISHSANSGLAYSTIKTYLADVDICRLPTIFRSCEL